MAAVGRRVSEAVQPLNPGDICRHPHAFREACGRGWQFCTRCGKKFRPAAKHGTASGYGRHQREREGEWAWPVPQDCGCRAAVRAKRREFNREPARNEAKNRRARSRMEALARLRRMYPGQYARFYQEEVRRRESREGRAKIPVWEDILAALVKAALDSDEDAVAVRLREGWATQREREVMRQLRRVRQVMEQLTPVVRREPR